jgi:hypothetical protein
LSLLLEECKHNAKLVKHLTGQKEFMGLAIVRISPDKDPLILRVSDSVLLLTNEPTHHKALSALQNSKLISKLKKESPCIKSFETDIEKKLFKFSYKFIRQDKRIKNTVVAFGFGDSEILLEITV